MSGLGKFIHVDDHVGADSVGISPLPKQSQCLASFLVAQRSILVLDTVSSRLCQSMT